MARLLPQHHRIVAGLGLLSLWGALASAAPPVDRIPPEPLWLVQTWTIAVCGQSLCDCGTARLVSEQAAPCEATALAGDCRTGTGHCCICEGRRTAAICAETLCECSTGRLLIQTSAPCTVTSSTGQCHIGSGQCCVCTLD
jgi:hypothetical protein